MAEQRRQEEEREKAEMKGREEAMARVEQAWEDSWTEKERVWQKQITEMKVEIIRAQGVRDNIEAIRH
jgi:hypothetical protein